MRNRSSLRIPGRHRGEPATVVPPDPRSAVAWPLDPALVAIRAGLVPHRRRLWLRRIVRRAWIAVAAVLAAELVLWTVARFVAIEYAPLIAVAIPVIGLVALIGAAIQARPSIGETALAVDAEGRLGDRVSSALELAVAYPAAAGPGEIVEAVAADNDDVEQFVRRQRRDALGALRVVRPGLFGPRFSLNPAVIAVVAALALAPVLLIANPQNDVIATNQRVREEANRQAERIEEIARDLEAKGDTTDDPRNQLAEELRELARQLRERPADLNDNLARVAATETRTRAQLDPANEQRASALTSLSRSLSRTATGQSEANPNGDPEETRGDLDELADQLDGMTDQERRELARQLAELGATASQADGGAATALGNAAQSLAQGDTPGARDALARLGDALGGAGQRVT
ncbi:MAG TPA: hypothetical protein VFU17_00475, partial [Candidatus Limnocylindrales bacterium]|nr:hypothetical protein [Candidatus Limnocylindrales bacterium]